MCRASLDVRPGGVCTDACDRVFRELKIAARLSAAQHACRTNIDAIGTDGTDRWRAGCRRDDGIKKLPVELIVHEGTAGMDAEHSNQSR